MSLQNTNLLIQGSVLPATFKGTPQDLFAAMLERMKIVSPTGVSFFIVSDTMPSSNVGPWLKGGTQWWVWDEQLKTYVPLDISESETKWFQVGATTPATTSPPIWLKTTADQTEAHPQPGQPVGWYLYNGTTWVGFTELFDKSVTLAKLAPQPVASLISFNAAGDAAIVSGGTPGQFPKINAAGTAIEWANFPVTPGTVNGLVGESRELVIQNHPANPDEQLDITADTVIMQSNSGDYSVAVNVVDLVDITVSGIGGLDTGSETVSTWYYVWLISNGASNGTLLSTSATTPVLPSGYVYKAMLGAVYNDSSGDLVKFHQTGRKAFTVLTEIDFGSTATGNYPLTTAVPPIAKTAFGVGRLKDTGVNNISEVLFIAGNSDGMGRVDIYMSTDNTSLPLNRGFFEVPMITAQSVYFGGPTPNAVILDISGYTI